MFQLCILPEEHLVSVLISESKSYLFSKKKIYQNSLTSKRILKKLLPMKIKRASIHWSSASIYDKVHSLYGLRTRTDNMTYQPLASLCLMLIYQLIMCTEYGSPREQGLPQPFRESWHSLDPIITYISQTGNSTHNFERKLKRK